MNKLRAANSAEAIVDGPRWRRAEVYVPSSLRPLSILDLALPRRTKHNVQRTFRRSKSPKSSTPRLARTTRRTRRPLPELVAEALTNDETAERRVISLATANTDVSRILLNSTHAAAPSSSPSPTRADSSNRDPQRTDNERAAPNRCEASVGRAFTRRSKWTTRGRLVGCRRTRSDARSGSVSGSRTFVRGVGQRRICSSLPASDAAPPRQAPTRRS
jgi:hypothetical protein